MLLVLVLVFSSIFGSLFGFTPEALKFNSVLGSSAYSASDVEKILSDGFQITDPTILRIATSLPKLQVCLDHYTFPGVEDAKKFYFREVMNLIDKYGSDSETDEFMRFYIDQLVKLSQMDYISYFASTLIERYEAKNQAVSKLIYYCLAQLAAANQMKYISCVAADLIKRYEVENQAVSELMHYCLAHLAAGPNSTKNMRYVFHAAMEIGNSEFVSAFTGKYNLEPENYCTVMLFKAKNGKEEHNEILKTLYNRNPNLDWTIRTIKRCMKSRHFKADTFKWLLDKGFPRTFFDGMQTLMDVAISAGKPELCDICVKYMIPPSDYQMLKWLDNPRPVYMHRYIERERRFQVMKQFMIYCYSEENYIPADIVREIMEKYVQVDGERLLLCIYKNDLSRGER